MHIKVTVPVFRYSDVQWMGIRDTMLQIRIKMAIIVMFSDLATLKWSDTFVTIPIYHLFHRVIVYRMLPCSISYLNG